MNDELNYFFSDKIAGAPHPMLANEIIGHSSQKLSFLSAFASNRLPQCWLLAGDMGIGKASFAWLIAKFLLTTKYQPADLKIDLNETNINSILEPQSGSTLNRIISGSEQRVYIVRRGYNEKRKAFFKNISIEDVRKLQSYCSLTIADGGKRIIIIDTADDLNKSSSNALLKLLEEPPKNTVFLLISHSPQSLLATIKSRCRELRLSRLTERELTSALRQINLTIPEDDVDIYSLLGNGSVGNSIRLLEHDGAGLYRMVLSFLNQLPNLNGFELEKFIGTFSSIKNRSRLDLLIELLNIVIARLSKAGITGHSSSNQILEDEKAIFLKLCPNPNTAKRWAELAQTQSENLKHGLTVNLDPGSLILDTFFRLEDCARTVR